MMRNMFNDQPVLRGTVEIREAVVADAQAMSVILLEIIEATGRPRSSSPSYVLSTYIQNPSGVRCSVAVDETGEVIGFQSLIRAVPGNPYGVAEGWGIIGTHISPRAHRKGVGAMLFRASRGAAVAAALPRIDATIEGGNEGALRYYEAIGFRTYREESGKIHKAFDTGIG